MFSVSSSPPDLLSSLAALAGPGLLSAGGAAKGKKSNQQQSDHLICEVRLFRVIIPHILFVSRCAASGRANTVTTAARSVQAAGPSSADLSSPGG